MNYTFPCKDCKDRYLGCHDKCQSYLSIKNKRDKAISDYKKQKHKEQIITETSMAGMKRMQSNRHNHN